MKVNTPEISWHARDPVYSCDVQPHQDGRSPLRIATAGTDSNVRIWYITINNENKATPEFASNLSRHNKAVNSVRWSPNGNILASGADDGCVILWQLSSTQGGAPSFGKEDEEVSQESWSGFKTLRGHLEDVYDMCWSSDGSRLISGSVDNSAIIWDITKGEKLHLLKDHRSFVQGVAWDPRDKMCATISCDRSLRIYNLNTYRVMYNITKMPMTSTNNEGESQTKQCRMFQDDTMKSFFRRLTFTPDGEVLIAPAGSLEVGENTMNTTFLFTRNSLPRPVVHLPGPSKATLAVRCCPVFFELRKSAKEKDEVSEPMDTAEASEKTDPSKEDAQNGDKDKGTTECKDASGEKMETKKESEEKQQSLFNLPYRTVFAVATEDSVLLYDTQQNIPFAMISNLHYSQLSDMSWSSDGKLLVVSSSDGYCTLIVFEDGELGIPYKDPRKTTVTEDVTKKVNGESSKIKNDDVGKEAAVNKDSNKMLAVSSDDKTVKEGTDKIEVKVKDKSPTQVATESSSSVSTKSPPSTNKGPQPRRMQVTTLTSSAPKPRRVTLTTLSSPQENK